jgi:hypothetical protein
MEDNCRECEELRKAVRFLSDYAHETVKLWDADKDHKVGKRLYAMSGLIPGYCHELDDALALVGLGDGRRG